MLLLSRRHLSGTLSSEVNLAKSPSSLLEDEKVLLGGKGEKDRKASAARRRLLSGLTLPRPEPHFKSLSSGSSPILPPL